MTKKAVLDIGSLKVKLAVFDTEDKKLVKSASHLTLLGKRIDEQGIIDDESLSRLDDMLGSIARELRGQVSGFSVIGTEALRHARNANRVRDIVSKHFPRHSLEIVDQDREAELFFTAVSREFPNQEIMAIDIGGGSIQLIKGKYSPATLSATISSRYNLSTGTYRLQQKYSPNNDVISTGLSEAKKYITEAYLPITETSPILIFGSTCMLDFIRSAGVHTVADGTQDMHPLYVKQPALQKLLAELQTLAPNQRDHFYPEGGYFMHGADYMLMNLLAAIDRVQPDRIYPTNLNSSYAFI